MEKGIQEILLSIIVPVYNVEDYLEKCLLSIDQGKDKINMEVILIDDGSTDNSGKLCDEFAQQNDYIKVFHIQNSGQARARNIGMEVAQGKYIYFLDSDDEICSDIFDVVSRYKDSDCDMIVTSTIIEIDCVQNIKNVINYTPPSNDLVDILTNDILHNPRLGYNIYAKGLIDRVGRKFSEKRDICEDDTWKFFVLQEVKNVLVVEEPFYEYKTNRKGSTVNVVNEKRLIPTIEETMVVVNQIPVSLYKNKERLYDKYGERMLTYLLQYVECKDKNIKKYIVKTFKEQFWLCKQANTRIVKLLVLRYVLGSTATVALLSKLRQIKKKRK